MEKNPYAKLYNDIKSFNVDDDSILNSHRIKQFDTEWRKLAVTDEEIVKSLNYFNEEALIDQDFAINFIAIFTSRALPYLQSNDVKLRGYILTLLQNNFKAVDTMKEENIDCFYNFITMLGEFYNRARIGDNKPINFLAESLLQLLIQELKTSIENCVVDSSKKVSLKFAKLILKQISLNGILAKSQQKQLMEDLFFEIRRAIIEIASLSSAIKAFFLMTMDLYYSNFTSLGEDIESLYTKYLLESESELDDNDTETDIKSEETLGSKAKLDPIDWCANDSFEEEQRTDPQSSSRSVDGNRGFESPVDLSTYSEHGGPRYKNYTHNYNKSPRRNNFNNGDRNQNMGGSFRRSYNTLYSDRIKNTSNSSLNKQQNFTHSNLSLNSNSNGGGRMRYNQEGRNYRNKQRHGSFSSEKDMDNREYRQNGGASGRDENYRKHYNNKSNNYRYTNGSESNIAHKNHTNNYNNGSYQHRYRNNDGNNGCDMGNKVQNRNINHRNNKKFNNDYNDGHRYQNKGRYQNNRSRQNSYSSRDRDEGTSTNDYGHWNDEINNQESTEGNKFTNNAFLNFIDEK